LEAFGSFTVFADLSFSVKTVQNSENSQYPNASKCFQISKTVQNSENSFLVSGTFVINLEAFYFWKHLEVLLFSLICLFSVKTVQNSENRFRV